MAKLLTTTLFKTLMIVIPFFIFTVMLLALWGVGGKIYYPDLELKQQVVEYDKNETKNYKVNEVKKYVDHDDGLNACDAATDKTNRKTLDGQLSNKIIWRLVV